MKESVNKVRPKDDRLEDNTAALELSAEAAEDLRNSVDKNTAITDRNTERMQQLEKRLADMNMPVHRFSEDKPDQVQSIRSVIEPVNAPVSNSDAPSNKPDSDNKQPKIEPKIKRKDDSFGMSIANAGKTFAASVYQAGADFGKSMSDQIGSELLPFYSDMKAAASKVTGGAIEAGKLVKSRFERKGEEKKEKRTGIVPQSVIEKTEKLEKVKELREKFRDRKRDHADHKVISTLKDIRGDLRKMMLIGLLKSLIPDFGSFGAAIGRFAGMFAKGGLITAFFLGMKNWAVKFGEASLKGIKSAFTSITSGIKETFTKTVDSIKDGWKKMFPDNPKVETASPKSKSNRINPAETKTPVLDKDGKPVLDKDGKPKFETKAVNTVERNVEKSSFEKMTTKAVVAEGGEVAAEKVGKDQLLKRMASKAGGRVVAGAAGGPVGELIATLLLVKDAIELGFDMLGIKLEPAKWIDEKLGTDSEAAKRAGLGKPLQFQAANPYESNKIDEVEQQAKKAVAEAKERDMQKQAAMTGQTVGNSVNTTNVINKGNSSPVPSPFATDASVSAMSQAFSSAFKRN